MAQLNNVSGSTQVYWIDYNPIYFAFKLLNHIFQFIIPSINELTSNKNKIPIQIKLQKFLPF